MDFNLRVRGLTRRWFINVFLIIACAVISCVVLFCVFLSTYFTTSASARADEYASDSLLLSNVPLEVFEETARQYTETFQYKNKIEVQVINTAGVVFTTSSGFIPETEVNMPDYEAAASTGTGYFYGRNASGEKIMAKTYLLQSDDGVSLGAVRWVISAQKLSRHIIFMQIITVFGGIILLLLFLMSGGFFLSSIIRPLANVNAAARKIAMGDFSTTLTVNGKNEISELCDSINFMASELKAAEDIKNDFISSVSHELRTPLTAIRGWGETAKMSVGVDNELVEKGLDVVLQETERLSSLVEELLDFSRMQNGKLKVEMSPILTSKVLGSAVNMYRELARQQNIELIFLPLNDEPFILGDINRLKQVFINIIDNAMKYTSAGGQIIAEMQLDEGCISVKISDTGAGIPAQDIDRVKEKFYKSNNSVRGSGIGLAVADEIIKQHGGLLFLESTEGVGTTVTAVLPVLEEQNTPADQTVSLEKAAEEATAQIVAEVTSETAADTTNQENSNE